MKMMHGNTHKIEIYAKNCLRRLIAHKSIFHLFNAKEEGQ